MSCYEPVLRRVFAAVVPGHRVLVVPDPQPATGHTPFGFLVRFPVTDEFAEMFFDAELAVWAKLSVPLRWQMISYLAGHEAMHALEITQGYHPIRLDTLRGVVANILADIRGDYLPALQRLTHWPTNRAVAYRLLCEPLATPADTPSDPLPHNDALRILSWGLLWMRCGRLRLADGEVVDAPTDPAYAGIWPDVLAIMGRARRGTWHGEADLVDELLDLVWTWTREEINRRGLPEPDDDQAGATGLVDTDVPEADQSASSSTAHPFYWQDPPDPDATEETTDDTGNEDGNAAGQQATSREEFDQQLREQLSQSHRQRGCAHGNADTNDESARSVEQAVDRAIEEITESDLAEIINAAEFDDTALGLPRHDPDWACTVIDPRHLDQVIALAHLIGPLAAHLATVLRPLLDGPARRHRATRHGSRLDFARQAARIHLHAQFGAETDPPIWLSDHRLGRGRVRVRVALVVDCSGSMISSGAPLAAACHTTAAGLLTAADELGGLIDIALVGFTTDVLPIREFGDTRPIAESIRLLAHAQATAGYTDLTPAIRWSLDNFQCDGADRHTRRLLIVLTDAALDPTDAAASAHLVTTAADTVRTIAIGLGDTDQAMLRAVTPTTITVSPTATNQLPELLRQILEDIAQ